MEEKGDGSEGGKHEDDRQLAARRTGGEESAFLLSLALFKEVILTSNK